MFSFSGVLDDGLELLVMVPQDVYDELEELEDDNNDEEILRRVQGATKLIFDETAKVLLCATNFKSRIAGVSLLSGGPAIGIYLSYPEGATRIDSSSSNNVRWVKYSVTKNGVTKEYTLSEDDLLTIEFDWGDTIKDHIPTDYAKEENATTNKNAILAKFPELLNAIKDYLGIANTEDGEGGSFDALTATEVKTAAAEVWASVWGEVLHTASEDLPLDPYGNIIEEEESESSSESV